MFKPSIDRQECGGMSGLRQGWALRTAIVAIAALAWMPALHTAAAAPSPQNPVYRGAEACLSCHQEEYEQWKTSPHAQTGKSEKFRQMWAAEGNPSDCLRCHSTGYDPATGREITRGITCEACHGPYTEGHPAAQKSMKLTIGSEMCQTCHVKSFQEWQTSQHSQKDIQCTGCHMAHRQGLRISDNTQLCGACHAKPLANFAQSTHYSRGLKCATCHMPAQPGAKMIHGNTAANHSFIDSEQACTTQTCDGCHNAAIHSSNRLVTLRQQVNEMQSVSMSSRVEQEPVLQDEMQSLRQEAQNARTSTLVGLGVGLGVGGFAGLILAAVLGQRRVRSDEQ